MEQIINIVLSVFCTICIGLITNHIYDKLKNHSERKSGFELNIKIKFKSKK